MLLTESLSEVYPNGIPETLQPHIERMKTFSEKTGVLSVTLLSNFGKDVEMSYKHDTDVYRGLIVQLASTYNLSSSDKLWLHPELCKGRSMYKGGKQAVVKDLDQFNSSVGVYSTHSIDEIGGYKEETYTIVDVGMEKQSEVILESWLLSGSNMQSAYHELIASKLVKQSQEKRDSIARTYGAHKRVMSSNYNMLYSDGKTYYYYNHGIKPIQGKALVNISPLIGCAMVVVDDKHIESDLMSCNQYINIHSLSEEQRARAFESCKWEGKNIVNTYTMRKPIEHYKTKLEAHNVTMYRLENGYFSANPVHSKLPADIVLYLTPQKEFIPQSANCHQHIRDGSIDLPASHENISKIMKHHWKDLNSKKYLNGNSLNLARDMVEKSLVK